MNRFFIDMDGVLSDFVGGVSKLFGIEIDLELWDPGNYEGFAEFGISRSDLWKRINATPGFWRGLERISEGFELFNALPGEKFIATSPSMEPACLSEKLEWIYEHVRPGFRNFMIGPAKYLLAGNGILIDDYDENCNRFRDAGGKAILFPQPWNSAYDFVDRRKEYIFDQI